MKNLELPRVEKKPKRRANIVDSLMSFREASISLSPAMSADLSKQNKLRSNILPVDYATRRLDSKLDINFSLNPGTIVGYSGDASDFYVKTSQNRNHILPKLMPQGHQNWDSGISAKKQPSYDHSGSDLRGNFSENFSSQRDAYQKKIAMLEKRVKELEEQKFVKQIVKKEKEEDNSFFSLGFEGATKKDDVDEVSPSKSNNLRAQNHMLKYKVKMLEKENKELKAVVNTYRGMVAQNNYDFGENSTQERSKLDDSDEGNTTVDEKPHTKRAKRGKQHDLSFFDRLSNILKVFVKNKSMYYTLESAVEEACRILDCGYARILLVNYEAKKVYHESGNDKMKSSKLIINSTDVQVIEKKQDNAVDVTVLNVVETVAGLCKPFNNEGKGISVPIYSIQDPDEFIGAIQVSEPFKSGNPSKFKLKKGMTKTEETLLEVFAKIVSLLIDCHQHDWNLKENNRKLSVYNETIARIASSRTHQELLEIVKSRFPAYFDFEYVGLLFYNQKEDMMFTFDIQRRPDGRFYTKEPLKYPARLGISGQCVTQNIEMVSLNEPRKNRYFQPDTDNSNGVGVVKNIIVALLKNEKGQKTGVLQLINKRGKQVIEDRDELEVRSVQKLLGSLISQINDISFAVNLSSTLNKTMIKIENAINFNEV